MKTQNTNKLAKKTAFVFKGNRDQNNFNTDPTTNSMQTVLSTVNIFKK